MDILIKKIHTLAHDGQLRIELLKYICVSIGGYISLFIILYALIDLAHVNKRVAYFLVYAVFYFINYILNLSYIFKSRHSNKKAMKYMIYILIFFTLNNAIYNTILFTGISYKYAVIITMGILFPLRFLSSKFIIYKS
jgi:putative flippase GtrA